MGENGRWQMVAWAVVAAVVVFAGARALGQRSQGAAPAPPLKVEGAGGRAPSSKSSRRPAGVFVHVAGAVRRPGLYRVVAGTRVAVAIRRAGGPRMRANLSAVNLAAKVQDGQQVVVPGPGAPAAAAGAEGAGVSSAGDAAGGAKISLGSASQAQLETLDGIGPALAGRIVAYRQKHGGFRSLEELQEVEGIGAKRFAGLKERVSP